MVIQCGRLNKSVVSASHVVLEPNLEAPWPSGLAIREQLIELSPEDNGKIEVTVEHMTDNIDSHLSEDQRQQVKQMLREECDVFAKDDWDTGCIKDLEMEIQLKDNVPVQRTYNAIPKHLYQEVKTHIQDLLHRGWIQKFCSSYSSPVVCVRKKDGSLWLCIDYRLLNGKTLPDRHPIPRIQGILDNLGGNS